MRIVYIGCVESSYVFLESLLNKGANIVGVITKEKSSFNSDFMDLTPLCQKFNIPYIYSQNSNEDEVYHFIKQCQPDLSFCFGWSTLIDKRTIALFKYGMVGFHPAELPNNRGRHPIIWALALGLQTTASTFFMIDKDADTGDIVSQQKIEISYTDNARTLMDKILEIGKTQVLDLWKSFESNSVVYLKQDKLSGNSWRKRSCEDGRIDWRMSSKSIYNLVRALTHPYIGAHFMYKGREIHVWSVEEIHSNDYQNIEPGKVINIFDDNSILIKAGDNLIKVLDHDPLDLKIGDYL